MDIDFHQLKYDLKFFPQGLYCFNLAAATGFVDEVLFHLDADLVGINVGISFFQLLTGPAWSYRESLSAFRGYILANRCTFACNKRFRAISAREDRLFARCLSWYFKFKEWNILFTPYHIHCTILSIPRRSL
jgi:hypothetical protein